MGTLTEQMGNLAADIRTGHEERTAWLGALRQEVGALRAEIRSDCRERRSGAKSLHRTVGKTCAEIHSDLLGARRAWLEATAGRTRSRSMASPAKPARTSSKRRK